MNACRGRMALAPRLAGGRETTTGSSAGLSDGLAEDRPLGDWPRSAPAGRAGRGWAARLGGSPPLPQAPLQVRRREAISEGDAKANCRTQKLGAGQLWNAVCVVYVWSMSGLCLVYVWSMCGLCLVYVWSMSGLSLVYPWSISGLSVVYLWSISGLCGWVCSCTNRLWISQFQA